MKMSKTIEVSPRGHYDSAPLLLEEDPDLDKLFRNPPVIQKPTPQNKSYWASADERMRRLTLVTGYLQHPKTSVRLKTLHLYEKYKLFGYMDQILFDVLAADPNDNVRREAARITWINEKEVNCEYAFNKAQDEIMYGAESHPVGPTRARQALNLLLETAPDEAARQALEKMVAQIAS
jgi:hypothetical protein